MQGFLKERTAQGFESGPIVDRQGNQLGTHEGIANFTVGQRKGLGLAHPTPLYVLSLHAEENKVVVGSQEELAREDCWVEDLYWVGIGQLDEPMEVEVKIRYRSKKVPASIAPMDERVCVTFYEPIADGISPGQAAVFYKDDLLIGGGWIVSVPSEQREEVVA